MVHWSEADGKSLPNILRLRGGGKKARRISKAREAMVAAFEVNDIRSRGVAKAQKPRRRTSHGMRMVDSDSDAEKTYGAAKGSGKPTADMHTKYGTLMHGTS
jgi:hypothetical protein